MHEVPADPREELIEEILERLPILPERCCYIKEEAKILSFCYHLHVNDKIFARDAGTALMKEELKDFIKLSKKLGHHILQMHGNSLEAIVIDGRHPFYLVHTEFEKLIRAARRGIQESANDSVPNKTEKRKKQTARDVTKMAAASYERLTGKQPSYTTDPESGHAHGPFHDFLTDLFHVSEIKASPESQMKEFIKERNRLKKG